MPDSRSRGDAAEILSTRALNRALLERQMLLQRASISVPEAIERLVALQAQLPDPPYIGLWTRLEEFKQDDLTSLMFERKAARTTLLRYTLHVATARDLLWLRPMLQPVMDRAQRGFFGKLTAGIAPEALASAGRALYKEHGALTLPQLRKHLSAIWPDHDPVALGYSTHYLLPLLHVPPGGTWGTKGSAQSMLIESWLGQSLDTGAPPERLVPRYLAAFGPASVMDVQAWSGLTHMREIVERLRPQLRLFKSETGKELFDLPEAPRPEADIPAPVRYLPEYDNVMVAYADRTRVMTAEHRKRAILGGLVQPIILVDGFVAGTWAIKKQPDAGTAGLVISPFVLLSSKDIEALAAEGARLLAFAAPSLMPQVRFLEPTGI